MERAAKKAVCLYMLTFALYAIMNLSLFPILVLFPVFSVIHAPDSFLANEGKFLFAIAIALLSSFAAWLCEKALAPYIAGEDSLLHARKSANRYIVVPFILLMLLLDIFLKS